MTTRRNRRKRHEDITARATAPQSQGRGGAAPAKRDDLAGFLRTAPAAQVGGAAGTAVVAPAQVLFEAGGKEVLPEIAQKALRDAAERIAKRARLPEAAGPLATEAGRKIAGTGAKALREATARGTQALARDGAKAAAQTAAKTVARAAGRAAAVGGAIDGVIAVVDVVGPLRRGEMTTASATKHVAKEAATGAAASAVGVAAVAGLVALTGPVGVLVAFGVGATASMGAKALLGSLFD